LETHLRDRTQQKKKQHGGGKGSGSLLAEREEKFMGWRGRGRIEMACVSEEEEKIREVPGGL